MSCGHDAAKVIRPVRIDLRDVSRVSTIRRICVNRWHAASAWQVPAHRNRWTTNDCSSKTEYAINRVVHDKPDWQF